MRVLVTGAAGFVGSHLCDTLLETGHEVVGLDAFIDESYSRAEKLKNLSGAHGSANFSFLEADLRSADLEPIVRDCDAIVHLAAMPGLMLSWTNPEIYVSCNVLASARLAKACRSSGVKLNKFIYVSTSSVYGSLATGDESSPLTPISPYGATKLAGEHLFQASRMAHNLPLVVLRYFSVYGPRQRPDMAYRILIAKAMSGDLITIYGDGRQSRTNTYVSDCIRGTVQALDQASVGETFNIGGGEQRTLIEAMELIERIVGRPLNVTYAPARMGDQQDTSAVTIRASQTFGYHPQVTLEDGLKRQVEWQCSV